MLASGGPIDISAENKSMMQPTTSEVVQLPIEDALPSLSQARRAGSK
jgi:hypothetical protein